MDTYASLGASATPSRQRTATEKKGAVLSPGDPMNEAVTIGYDSALWRLDGATETTLKGLWPGVSADLDLILNEFYRFMGNFPENAPHLANKGKVDCLRLLQKEHWQVFFRGDFTQDYIDRVHRIGSAHAKIGLPTRYVLAGYSFLLEQLIQSVFRRHRRRPAEAETRIIALVRAVLMEAYIASEVYTETTNKRQMLLNMQELAETFENELDQAVQFVRRSATDMETASDAVLQAAQRVAEDSERAAEASENADTNAQAIAAGAEELSASIAEISRQVEYSSAAAQNAAQQSQSAKVLAENLNTVSHRIGSIVQLIEKISKETRLLALNANIEAARAGDAGRGFAVVANEVKILADQTNRATGEIRSEIQAMQAVIRNTAEAIGDVAAKVEFATGNISGIAGAVTEQEAVTREIAQSAAKTADSIHIVHDRISSVSDQAEASNRETTRFQQDTHGLVDQVVGIKRRVIATLRNTHFADRRREIRVAVDRPAKVNVNGRSWSCRTDNLSMGGVQLRSQDLARAIVGDNVPILLEIAEIGELHASVVNIEADALHVRFDRQEAVVERRLSDVVDSCRRADAEIVALAKETAAHIGRLFEEAIDQKEITWDQLWDVDYRIIKDTDPPQYTTKFLTLCDRILPNLQEPLLTKNDRISFAVTVDRNGYLPTHNKTYSQPQRPGDKVWNTAHCRNRRIFDDRTGLSAARNRQPILIQTYRRDMGGDQFVSMKDVSAPVMVRGQHWGGFRIGART